ncbi:hypothetical protein GJ744_000705 [Endocarpon pusillum]|uniref:Uncharacterized protein n=1 Tax=Endocarpon pusillum TaxID=364733 RepID=A0A8H7E2C4_9EURO|nr:hypothetical protein GJ744_000705 [Endocarpon pusillum]
MINTHGTKRRPPFQAVCGHLVEVMAMRSTIRCIKAGITTTRKPQLELKVKNPPYGGTYKLKQAMLENSTRTRATDSIIFVLHVDQGLAHGSICCSRTTIYGSKDHMLP